MMQIGIDPQTGTTLKGLEHIKMCIMDIITTRIGTRLMRREYGSYAPYLLDSAMNDAGKLRVQAAITDAIMRYEPRVKIKRVSVSAKANGKTEVEMHIIYQNKRSLLFLSLN